LLIFLNSWQPTFLGGRITKFLATNGQNPMVAYVAGNLLLTPVLHLTGLVSVMNVLNASPVLGFLKGLIFTGIVSLITYFFTLKKWFWKS
jgi:hypothetical protein